MNGTYKDFFKLAETGKDPTRFRDYLGQKGRRILHPFIGGDIDSFSIEQTDKHGWTALMLASDRGNADAVRDLIAAGANLEAMDRRERTPLLLALKNNRPAIARMLIEAGANIHHHDRDLARPIHYAAEAGDAETTRLLLERGVDVDAMKSNGSTPLLIAVYYNNVPVVRVLLERGARADIADQDGDTALTLAEENLLHLLPQLKEAASARSATPPSGGSGIARERKEESADGDFWTLVGKTKVAHVETSAALQRKLTEIFNFENGERLIVTENLKSGTETIAQPERFEALPPVAVAKAAEEFRRLGGKAPSDGSLAAALTAPQQKKDAHFKL